MAEDKSSKTEKATPEQLRKAKEEGNIARTQDFSMWLTVLAFYILGPTALSNLFNLVTETLRDIAGLITAPSHATAMSILRDNLMGYVIVIAPVVLLCMFLGAMGHVVQGGVKPAAKRFKPKFNKLNIFKGIKSRFGMQALWAFVKTLLKFGVFGVIAYLGIKDTIALITGTGRRSIETVLMVVGDTAFKVMLWIIVAGLIIAVADYAVEKHRVEKSLRMSKDEIKREHKQQEGDPQIKGQRRARQREMGQRRMMAAVGESTVVLTNPVHVSVALKYVSGEGAPQVVAKGAGLLARRIREEAEATGVPIVRDVIIARTLYKMCEVDSYIPMEMYDTIATVLAFLMRMSDMRRTEGEHKSPIQHPGWNGVDLPDDLSDEALGITTFGGPEGASYDADPYAEENTRPYNRAGTGSVR